jgi:endoglucanase
MKRTLIPMFFVVALLIFSCQRNATSQPVNQTQQGPQVIPDMIMNNVPNDIPSNPAMTLVRNMGVGINIGNSLDAIGTHTWHSGETGWGNPVITRDFVRALKAHGYKSIRLPVTWAEYMGPAPDFLIGTCIFPDCNRCPDRMDRVQEVVNWILAEDMYVIINIHHDGGYADKSWIIQAADDPDGVAFQFAAVWRQIAQRFAGVSQDMLIFESMNEVGFDTLWNRYGGSPNNKTEAYRILNMLNQTFVDTVRGVPGNENRFLLIAGYWTDIQLSVDPFFQMPNDTVEHRQILSLHYYTPSTFCIAEEPDNSWGFRDTWGTPTDYFDLTNNFNMAKRRFIDNGIPIILGEYGATLINKDEESRIKWVAAVTQLSLNYNIHPMIWDTGWKIDNNGREHGGEISRYAPYEMRESLQAVWDAIVIR